MVYQRANFRSKNFYDSGFEVATHKRLKRQSSSLLTALSVVTCFILFSLKENRTSRLVTVTLPGETPGFELCKRHSFGLFSDIRNDMWTSLRESVMKHRLEAKQDPSKANSPEFLCPHKLKVGPSKICEPDQLSLQIQSRSKMGGNSCLVYKVGSHDSFDFEEAVHGNIDENCEIHVFGSPVASDDDDLNEVVLIHPPNVHFHEWDIQMSQSSATGLSKTVEETLAILGHEGRTIDVLRLECPGECNVSNWFVSNIIISQILVQFREEHQINMDTLHTEGYVNFGVIYDTSARRSKTLDMSLLKLSLDFVDESGKFDPDDIEIKDKRIHQEAIPHNIFFTYKDNILETQEPPLFYENVMKTAKAYKDAWNDPDAPIIFLDNDGCADVVEKAHSELLPHFQNERKGILKADICRIAALYVHGGYYFDVDIEVIEPVMLAPEVSFSTAQTTKDSFFQAFMASTKHHPVLTKTLEVMLEVYKGKRKVRLLGTNTLQIGFSSVSDEIRGETFLLTESVLHPHMYEDVKRREGYGCCCNVVVHNPYSKVAHFYSRIVGYSKRCSLKPWGTSSGSQYEFG